MKIDRLIGILSILLQMPKTTAAFLAEKFEVSVRTINRDVDTLSQAGIPIVTEQGKNGGISIMENYKLDKTLLTSSDMRAILAGLRSLDSVSGTNRYQQLMDKLSLEDSNILPSNNHILIDLSSWYKSLLAPKIELIQDTVERQELISFLYHSPKGESVRIIEPYLLVFQWSSWYVWGYCRKRADFRLFKLNRMTDLKNTKELYEKRAVPLPNLSADKMFETTIYAEVVFEPEMKWRLVEEFGIDSFKEREDGKLLFSFGFAGRDHLYGWLLSFGNKAELQKPEELREELFQIFQEMEQRYDPSNLVARRE
ncbi:MAG: YafY family transcriptional regulator [Lachnospiraceae bacterium]|nr:YafY family transcriptional regulator [Lachnospiraceae bacterium]